MTKYFSDCDVLVMVAAVGDFAPENLQKEKIKKNGEPLVLKFLPTVDILKEVAKIKGSQVVVGFAAESENVVQSAQEKLHKKNLDLIVANDISRPGLGMEVDDNEVVLMAASGERFPYGPAPKGDVATFLLERIRAVLE